MSKPVALSIAKKRLAKSKKSQSLIRYEHNPVGFIQEVLGIKYLTSDQIKLAESVRDNKETYCQSAHGQGKTALSSWILLWWVFGKQGLCVSTAPTFRQVAQLLFGEVRIAYDRNKYKLGGERGETFVRLSQSARAFGYTAADHNTQAFSGVHHEKLLVIIDEAGGVGELIWDGVQSLITGASNRLLAVGNPITPGSQFEKNCKRRNIRIPAWNHPNISWAYQLNSDGIHRLKPEVARVIVDPVSGDVIPQEQWPEWCERDRISGAVSISWIETVRTKKGETSPYWLSRVEAEFPGDDSDGIIPLTLLKQARDRYDANPQYWDALAKRYPWRLGLDVGDGGDPHALALLRGPVIYEVQIHPTKGDLLDTDRAADIAAREIKLLGTSYSISVDNTGVGAGTLAKLKRLGYISHPCKFGDAPSYRKSKQKEPEQKFTNRKAELYWQFREALRLGKIAIAPLENEEYVFQDLTATRYSTNTKDEIFCEPKEKTKSRLGRSPDSEAIVIALNTPMEAGGIPQDSATALSAETNNELEELHKLFS